jgi:hypothetical protein
MSFSPHNASVYIQGLAGAVSGMRALGNAINDGTAQSFLTAAAAADAFAQMLDTQWQALIGTAPTNFELSALLQVSQGVWALRSPLTNQLSGNPGNYVAAAQGVVALVMEANAQIVAQGVDPNSALYTGGGGGSGITQLTGAVTAGPGSGSQVATLVLGAGATVTGVLPTANQASQAMGGDVSGTTAAATVIKINGTTVPAGGALTPGNVLTVSGVSAATWQAPASGGLTAPVSGTFVTKTTNYTLDSGGSDFGVFADTSGGAWNLTFPAPSANRGFYIVDVKGTFGTNNLSLLQHAAEKINGLAATKVLQANWGHYWIWSNGTDWFVS